MNHSENPSDTNAGDLPDIIDVVMEMGVVQAKVPSPPLAATAGNTDRIPGHLEGLADKARD